MTKTKRQLRAEAVERLKAAKAGKWNMSYAIVGHAYSPDEAIDTAIMLLTDDDSTTQEVDSTTESLSDWTDSREKLEDDIAETIDFWGAAYPDARVRVVIGWLDRQAAITANELTSQSDVPKSGKTTENSTAKNEICDFDDTREKLEAEASELVADYAVSGNVCDALYHGITALLDRQDAITRRECDKPNWDYCETCELTAEHDQLINAINELQKKQPYCYGPEQPLDTLNTIGRYINELTAERDMYREKLSCALDLAHEIGRLMP